MQNQNEIEVLLQLMSAALRPNLEKPLTWNPACNLPKLEEMILTQNLVSIVYPVIERQEGTCWSLLREHLRTPFDRAVHKAVTQEYEIQALLHAMEKDSINCLPMKGWVMRNYYPNPLMRSMSDFDLLIQDLDGIQMQEWMKSHGYIPVRVRQSFHEQYKKPPYMFIELHHHLLYENTLHPKPAALNEEAIWHHVIPVESKQHIYQLHDEAFYLHHLLHFYRHFTSSGVGLRFLADFYVFLRQKGSALNWEYIDHCLEELHLLDFSEQMKRTAMLSFEDQSLDEKASIIVNFLVSGGVHGSEQIQEISYLLNHNPKSSYSCQKVRSLIRRCFPPLAMMQDQYTRLCDTPWLLPFYWGVRAGRIFFRENERIKIMRTYQTREEYQKLKTVYRAAGIIKD